MDPKSGNELAGKRIAVLMTDGVVVDGALVTSRKPDDIPAFDQALLEKLTHPEATRTVQ